MPAGPIATLAATVWRNFISGNPLDGKHRVNKAEVIDLFDLVDAEVEAAKAAATDNFAEFVVAQPNTNANSLLDGFHIATAATGLNFPTNSGEWRILSFQATTGATQGSQQAMQNGVLWVRAKTGASAWTDWVSAHTPVSLPRATTPQATSGANVVAWMGPSEVAAAITARGTVQVGHARVKRVANEVSLPTEKSGNSAWATGNAATAFLMEDNSIHGCGSSFSLGLPITADVPIFLPRQIPIEARTDVVAPVFTQVALSQGAIYALDDTGNVWSAGLNVSGALGHGDTVQRRSLKRIEFFASNSITVTRIVTPKAGGPIGDFVHFITSTTQVYACGANGSGQLGDGTTTQRNTPVRCGTIDGITRVVSAGGLANSVAFGFVGALRNDGQLFLWGLNTQGAVGDGTTTNRTTPHSSLASVADFDLDASFLATVNLSYAVAVLTSGATRGIGYNVTGQIGDGTIVSKSVWTAGVVAGALNVWTGGGPTGTTVYRTNTSELRTIGHNGQGQCGNGGVVTPQLTAQIPQFGGSALFAGPTSAVLITGIGAAAPTTRVHFKGGDGAIVVGFGAGALGVLSTEGAFTAAVATPRAMPALSGGGAVALSPAGDATGGVAARFSNGRVFAAGTNNEGALGISPDQLTGYDAFGPVMLTA